MTRRFLGIAALLVVIVLVYFLYQPRGLDAVDGHLCAQEYARARSASESTAIDARPPIRNRGRGELSTPSMTCGELRRSGNVR
jgi:hypothetical protein